MDDFDYLYKTKPNYFFVFLMIIGSYVCAFLANLMWSSIGIKKGLYESTSQAVITYIFLGFLVVFFFGFSLMIVWIKIIYLTEDQVIISIPLFFTKRVILFSEIKGITEKEEQIDVERSAFSRDMMTIGHNTTLQLADGKKANISSLQVWGYVELIKRIHVRLRTVSGRGHNLQ